MVDHTCIVIDRSNGEPLGFSFLSSVADSTVAELLDNTKSSWPARSPATRPQDLSQNKAAVLQRTPEAGICAATLSRFSQASIQARAMSLSYGMSIKPFGYEHQLMVMLEEDGCTIEV
ncbi:hypothetical protein PLEOSDRAFT_165457 [Pleurotus ostreatus PC15]|uniref:Uncharacterized protein n=1 Tax=Pleurotus ostreatus (strain PC15) TaxID=1137138 RepID=A0A067NYW1_PLEO1|nr:hypothetical protein PLEOSDRAFT_165457 [Pleurotus ostreatus PC15]